MKTEPKYLKTRICIIGAGPGGATTSLYLSRFGIPHVVVDKHVFPRDKVCGESFDGRVYRILQDLLPDFQARLGRGQTLLETWNYQFHSDKINLAVAFPKANLPRLSTQRLELDQLLVNQMKQSPHTEILTGYPIYSIEQQNEGLRLQGDGICIDAELVVKATGEQITDKQDASLFVFSRCYYEGVETKEEKGLEVYYFKQPLRGCLFLCPLTANRYNVEIGVERNAYIASGLSMDVLQEAYLQNRPGLRQRFLYARPLGKRKGTSMRLRTKAQWVTQNTIHVGSGAFCVNPITGLGVGNAMSMGKLVAEQIRDLYDQNDFAQQLISQYPKAAKKKYRNILLMNRAVNLIQRYFRFFEPVLAVFLNKNFVQRLLLQKDLVKNFSRWKFYKKLSNERSRVGEG